MAKKLTINCASCDTRKVTEEKLAAYEEVTINAALVLSSAESRAIMDRYPVTMNCAKVLDVEGDVQVSTINGHAAIKSTDVPTGERRYLIVNGSLEIGPDTRSVLEGYVGILVNGSATYPESVNGCLGMLTINGSTLCYPDGAIVLKKDAVIDRTFALRAKNSLYWSAKRMIVVDPKLDVEVLKQKGATFSTKEAIIAESKVEQMAELLDERTEIVVVPDGTAVILDDVTLNAGIVKKYGTKLYILGDLTIEKEGENALESLEYLTVQGDISVHQSLEHAVYAKDGEITGDVRVIRHSKVLRDKVKARISAWMLEREKDGLLVMDCAEVQIDPDVTLELITEKLSIRDCATVVCTEEQEAAVNSICEGVADVGPQEGENGLGGMIRDMINGSTINAADYVM